MNGFEIQRERERLGISVEDLSSAVGVASPKIEKWEREKDTVPKRSRKPIEEYFRSVEATQLLQESGLPECAWMEKWAENFDPTSEKVHSDVRTMQEHTRECPICTKRREYVDGRLGPLESPGRGDATAGTIFVALEHWKDRVLVGAIITAILGAVTVLLATLPHHGALQIPVYLVSVGIAASIGLTLYYALSPLHHWGALVRWFSRVIASVPAMIGFVSVYIITGYDGVLSREGDPIGWSAGITIGTMMGVAYATIWPIVAFLKR